MVNLKLSKYSFSNIHGYMSSNTVSSPVNFYSNQTKWWKKSYGDPDTADFVQVLMVDTDENSAKVVKVIKGTLNDTRMFINFGELARIKGYVPNNCSFDLGENANVLYRDSDGNL